MNRKNRSRLNAYGKPSFLFLALVANLFSVEENFYNFGKESPKEHFCEIILKSVHWSRMRCHLKAFSIFSSGGYFVQWNKTILAILVGGHPRNISVKLF